MKRIWTWLTDLLEYGDLVPAMVLVSAVHYAVVLAGKDHAAIAVLIGLLTDLGHYRAVRAAVRYMPGKRKGIRRKGNWLARAWSRIHWQMLVRWCAVCVMTAVSLTYHQRYYGDWWLSAPLPLLIAFLAWQQHVDRNVGKRKDVKPVEHMRPAPEYVPVVVDAPAEHKQFECADCDASFRSSQARAAHIRWKHRNGHEKEKMEL